ncbi:MAG TPA: CBS domain-containing protein [Streptosporangiaceae bacterium]|nr:CBS domain-containing protein [Streptosporangiaceae bacterium]
MRKVRDIMSAAPVCMGPGDSVSAAARAMKRHGAGTVLVLAGGRPSGLLTGRDIAMRMLAGNRDPEATQLGDICGGELVMIGPDDDVAEAVRLVRERAVRRIPVLAGGTPLGVVSAADLALEADPPPCAWPARS